MSYLVFAWISSFSYMLLALFSKFASLRATANPWLLNFAWTLLSFLLLIPIAATKQVTWPSEWVFLILSAICNAVWLILYALSLYRLDISVISPLYNFQNIFVIVLSFLFLQERLVPVQLLLIAVIFAAGMFVSIDEKFQLRSFFSKSVGILITGMFFLALSRIFTNLTLKQNGVWETTIGTLGFTLIALLPTYPLFKKEIPILNIRQLGPFLLMAISYVAGTIAAYEAFRVNVGISSVIISLPLTLVAVIILSYFKPNLLEKHTAKVYAIRLFAASVMIVCALLLPR